MRRPAPLLCRLMLTVCMPLISLMGGWAPLAHAAGGSTWYWQNPLPGGYQLSAITCSSATACVAAGFDGSITTTGDDGLHWTDRSTGIAAGLSYLSCPASMSCYALGSLTPSAGPSQNAPFVLLHSMDSGATWQVVSHLRENSQEYLNSLACPTATICLIAVGQPAGAFMLRTANGGKTWQSVHLAGISGIYTVVCPTATVCYAEGGNNSGSRLLRSSDSGATWSSSGLQAPKQLHAIACPGKNTCFGTGWSCTSGCWGIFLTTNGARSWKKMGDNLAGHLPGNLACPSVTTCYALAATGSNAYNTSVVGTTNGGKTWSVHHLPDSAFQIVCPSGATCLLNAGFTVLTTRDGFLHTHETLARSPLHNLTLTDIGCPGTTRCYAAALRHVCDSIGGECNQVASPGAVTVDGGRTWSTRPAPPDLIGRLSCPSPNVCYAIAGETGATQFVERSGDGTRTWHRIFPAACTRVKSSQCPGGGLSGLLTDLSCPTATTCYVTASLTGPGTLLAVLVTHDAGKTWTAQRRVDALAPQSAGPPAPFRRALVRVSCLSVTTCFVLAASFHQSTATMALLFTSDGGQTWTRKSVPDMKAGDSPGLFTPPLACPTRTTCYLLRSNGSTFDPSSTGEVLVTNNAGSSWRRSVVKAGAILTDMACPTTQVCRVVGWDGIFATEDGGKTWKRQVMADGTPVPQLSSIACPAAGTCYAVGGRDFTAVTIVGARAAGRTP